MVVVYSKNHHILTLTAPMKFIPGADMPDE